MATLWLRCGYGACGGYMRGKLWLCHGYVMATLVTWLRGGYLVATWWLPAGYIGVTVAAEDMCLLV